MGAPRRQYIIACAAEHPLSDRASLVVVLILTHVGRCCVRFCRRDKVGISNFGEVCDILWATRSTSEYNLSRGYDWLDGGPRNGRLIEP